jgi:hypothetical protein
VKIGASHKLWILFGTCTYDATTLRRPRPRAWIAAAGPAASLISAALLWVVDGAGYVALTGALTGTGIFLFSAIPVRYGAGIGGEAGDSDGLVVWRVLTGGPPGGPAREERRRRGPERAMRPLFMILLAPILIFTVSADPLLLHRPRVG